jgi:hypothetical protein
MLDETELITSPEQACLSIARDLAAGRDAEASAKIIDAEARWPEYVAAWSRLAPCVGLLTPANASAIALELHAVLAAAPPLTPWAPTCLRDALQWIVDWAVHPLGSHTAGPLAIADIARRWPEATDTAWRLMRAYSQSNKRKLATAALHALLILQPEPSDAEGTAANDAP